MHFNGKKAITMLLITSMLLSFTVFNSNLNIVSASPTTIYIDPTPITVDVCNLFTANVNIADVSNLNTYQVNMTFDPNLMDLMSVVEGPFLMSAGPTIFLYQNGTGWVMVMCALMMPIGVSGSGTLFYLNFHCKGPGSCPLHFKPYPETMLYDSYGMEIPFETVDGNVNQIQPSATLYIDPTPITVAVCSNFTANINIANVNNLNMWQINITFDSTLMDAVSVVEGPFLQSVGPTIFGYQSGTGWVMPWCALIVPLGASGSGTLAYLNFHCKGSGSCPLHFKSSETVLYDSMGNLIPFNAIDGSVKQLTMEKCLHSEYGLFYSVRLHADYLINLYNPICTYWHELWPYYCRRYHLTSWEDNGDNMLSPSDQIDMIDMETEEKTWWHVDDVTVTIKVSEIGVPSPTPMYLEFVAGFPKYTHALLKVVCTWHEVYPVFSPQSAISQWNDTNGDGMLSYCDNVYWAGKWYHVDQVATDIIVTRKPVCTQWHEIYPEFCMHDYHLSSWIDNGDDVLSYCDKIDLTDKVTGEVTWWHVTSVTVTMVLTEKYVPPPVEPMYVEYIPIVLSPNPVPPQPPVCTYWHEIWPVYCRYYHLTSWEDNGDGWLSPSDQIDMTDEHGIVHWYHVDDIAIDIWIEPIPQPVHDVAVINVVPKISGSGLRSVLQGETVPIDVDVQNQGNFQETFSVDAYADIDPTVIGDEIVIGTQTITLNPGQTTTLTFNWDTTGVAPATYTISAYAHPVPLETDLADNTFIDGTVTVVQYLYLHAEDGLFYSVRLHASPPIYPVYYPICTTWHELWPYFCSHYYHLNSWEDTNFDERLSPSDQIDMIDMETEQKTWWHVDDVTVTIYLSDIEGILPPMYIESSLGWPAYDWILKLPLGTPWHEIWPVFCKNFTLTSWIDSDGNGEINYCDYIDLTDELGIVTYWHVEEVTTDITVTRKPICTHWHALFPKTYFSQYYHLSSWEDNGDDVLSACDQIDLHVEWPEFHHDPELSGYSTSTAPNTNTRLWTYKTGGPIRSSPAIVNEIVYIGSDDCNLYALDAKTGALIWSFATGGPVKSSPAVAYGRVYFLSCDGNIYCLNAANGMPLWIVPIDVGGRYPWSSPAVTQGKVFIAASLGFVHCLNAFNGAIVWSTPVGGTPNGPVTVANNKVFSGTHTGLPTLIALDEATGAVVWQYFHPGGSFVNSNGAAVVDGDCDGKLDVYFGVAGTPLTGEAIALNEADGSVKWTYTFRNIVAPGGWGPGWSTSTPAVHARKIYIGSDDGYIYALDAGTGAKVWDFQTKGAVWSAPAVADGKVFAGSLDHMLYALNENTGTLVWCYNTSLSRIWGSPAVACGKVFVGSQNGKVYAFGSQASAVQWYHVVDVTVTIKLTEKYIEPAPLLYLEFKHPEGWNIQDPCVLSRFLADPVCTTWHELWPKYCHKYHLTSWEDNGDGWLSPSDQIDMIDENETIHWYHVDDISVDIVIEPKPPCPKVEWTQAFGPIDYIMRFCPSPGVANLDKDLGLEIVTGTDEWHGWQKWHCFDASGAYQWTLPTRCDESRTSVAIGDIDGDGDLEIAGGCTSGWETQVFDHAGSFVWRYPVPPFFYDWWHGSPAMCDVYPEVPGLEVIAVRYSAGMVYCFDKNGNVLWTFVTGGTGVDASPACGDVDGDGDVEIVIGATDIFGTIYCLNGRTGAVEWANQAPACVNRQVHSSAALADIDNDGIIEVIVGRNDGGVYCLTGTTGAQEWVFGTNAAVQSSPAVGDVDADGTLEIIVGSLDGKVYCLNGLGGVWTLEWSYQTGGSVISSAALANRGTTPGLGIYIGSKDGYLYVLDGIGNLVWNFNTGATRGITSSPAVADIDGDSKLEVMFTDWNAIDDSLTTTNIFWVLEDCRSWVEPYVIEWAMFRHDRCHTGKYSSGIGGGSAASSETKTVERSAKTLSPEVHDVAISFDWLSKSFITAGETVDVYVTVENQGEVPETTNITVTYDGHYIGSAPITVIPGIPETLTFPWDTTGVPAGAYSVTAEASDVPGEIDIIDNTFSTLAIIKPPKHDIAIVDINHLPTAWKAYGGFINVTIFNQGDFSEEFGVAVSYGSIAATKAVTMLPGESATVALWWDPSIPLGTYNLSAFIATPISGETDVADNTYTDDWIRVTRVGDLGGGLPPKFFAFDDKIDGLDLALFIACYRKLAPPEAMYLADLGGGLPPKFFQFDGRVDGIDLALWIACYRGLGPSP